MRTQANVGRRLLGVAAVAAFATAVLSGCVLAPVVSTVLEPEEKPSSTAPAQSDTAPAADRAPMPSPSVKAERNEPDLDDAPGDAPDGAVPDEESSTSRDNSIFGPPRSSPPAPRVTVRIELPHES